MPPFRWPLPEHDIMLATEGGNWGMIAKALSLKRTTDESPQCLQVVHLEKDLKG